MLLGETAELMDIAREGKTVKGKVVVSTRRFNLRLERATEFKYLGSMFTGDGGMDTKTSEILKDR